MVSLRSANLFRGGHLLTIMITKNQANESSSFRLVFVNKSSICGQIIRSSGSVALYSFTASYFCCSLRTALVILARYTWRFCACQTWLLPAARVTSTSLSSGVRYASRSNSATITRFIRDLSKSSLFLLGLLVIHGLSAVFNACGGRVGYYTQDHQHSKRCVDHGNQLIADVSQVQGVAEYGGHGLNQQQYGGDYRQPKVLVLDNNKFRWYINLGNDYDKNSDIYLDTQVEGRKNNYSAQILSNDDSLSSVHSSTGSYRRNKGEIINLNFVITYKMAQDYRKSIGKYLRKNQWSDAIIDVAVEL